MATDIAASGGAGTAAGITKNPKDKVSFLVAFSYGAGSFGANLTYFVMATYLMFFYTDSVGLKAAAVATMFLVTKCIDAITDIMWGIIVDNTSTRWGKFKPFIFVGTSLTVLTTIALYISPDFDEAGKLVYAYATYILWNMTFSILDTSYWSLSSAITQDPDERVKVVAVPRTVAAFGQLAISAFTLPLVRILGSWTMAVTIIMITAAACLLLTLLFVPENYSTKRETSQSPVQIAKMFVKNTPFTLIMISMFLLEMVSNIKGCFQLYFFKYNLGMENVVQYYLTLTLVFQLIGSSLSPFISKLFGKKNSTIGCYIAMSVFGAALFLFQHEYWGVMIIGAIISFFTGVANITGFSMIVDCIEYNEWKTGERSEGAVFSLNIFKSQISNAIGVAFGGYVLAWAGFVANTDLSAHTLFWIGAMFTFIPAILTIFALIPMFKYEITEKRFLEIVAILRERRAAKAAAEAGTDPAAVAN
ncbi:MFS transporter [Bifidobacterium aerophilum]|uniref:MFS transporter n=1 Tax=Bifidobacterium aerophilum TaxID=1798155 RepID=A0A6N9Z323_9BIFI|nr:glycoside-pentoside-hexuronide (GPH):cation symporter [Bifidobacterium aerophilum]NEG88830.1 MFS transporter [Bifidobacterium aerophilum]